MLKYALIGVATVVWVPALGYSLFRWAADGASKAACDAMNGVATRQGQYLR